MSLRLLLTVLVLANVVVGASAWCTRATSTASCSSSSTRLEKERDELNIEFGRLQLEQATWAESNRIDQVARDRLGMEFPAGRRNRGGAAMRPHAAIAKRGRKARPPARVAARSGSSRAAARSSTCAGAW